MVGGALPPTACHVASSPEGPSETVWIFWERLANDTPVVTSEYGHGDRGVGRENINRAGWFCVARFDGGFAVCVGGFWGWIGGGFWGGFPLLDT